MILNLASYIIICLYAILIIFFATGWLTQKASSRILVREIPVTILIPFRNEADNLLKLVNSINQLSYKDFSVVFINDHSTDNGSNVINENIASYINYKILEQKDANGKKHALLSGIKEANTDIVLQTDADCVLPAEWIGSMVAALKNKKETKLVCGNVRFLQQDGLWQKYFEIEMYSLTGTTVGAINRNMPVFCNGANMAYYKNDYQEFLEEHLRKNSNPSGDDVFFLQFIVENFGANAITSLAERQSTVFTEPPLSIKEFVEQHLRWASKTLLYKSKISILTALLVASVSVVLIVQIIIGFITKQWDVFILIFVVKMLIDSCLLFFPLRLNKRKALLLFLPLFEIFYMLEAILIPPFSLVSKVTWKK